MKDHEKKSFLDLDTGPYRFDWNPLKSDADAFAIYLIDNHDLKTGWYLDEKTPGSGDIDRSGKGESLFRGKWGLLNYFRTCTTFEAAQRSAIRVEQCLDLRSRRRRQGEDAEFHGSPRDDPEIRRSSEELVN